MRLGSLLSCSDLVCLVGELGAGKTVFVQGIAAGWGSVDLVSSPSFVLVNLYRRPDNQRLYHLDAYRLRTANEALDLDLDSMLETGAMVIEWADRIKSALPEEHLWVKMRLISDEQRDMLFTAKGAHYRSLMTVFRKQLYGDL